MFRFHLPLYGACALFCIALAVSSCAPPPQTTLGQNAAPPSGETFTNSIGMEFVRIPAGSFLRHFSVKAKDPGEKPYRPKVTISKPFYLGKYEVTQKQWMAVMGNNPSQFKGLFKGQHPVEMVSWDNAQEFIRRLNEAEGHNRYRLPTEAEWEFAARGGTDRLFFFMEDPKTWEEAEGPLDDYAWCRYRYEGGSTFAVGQKKPNPYGLYDIYGNVWELVQDRYEDLPEDREVRDYYAPARSTDLKYAELRVFRGGGWYSFAAHCRSNSRFSIARHAISNDTGFRLALSIE